MIAIYNTSPAVRPGPGASAITKRPDRREPEGRAQLLWRVRAEFEEMPCLRLTQPQAQRLFGLREDICRRVLASLIQEGKVQQDDEGRYWAGGIRR
jgi:hypothetical protein